MDFQRTRKRDQRGYARSTPGRHLEKTIRRGHGLFPPRFSLDSSQWRAAGPMGLGPARGRNACQHRLAGYFLWSGHWPLMSHPVLSSLSSPHFLSPSPFLSLSFARNNRGRETERENGDLFSQGAPVPRMFSMREHTYEPTSLFLLVGEQRYLSPSHFLPFKFPSTVLCPLIPPLPAEYAPETPGFLQLGARTREERRRGCTGLLYFTGAALSSAVLARVRVSSCLCWRGEKFCLSSTITARTWPRLSPRPRSPIGNSCFAGAGRGSRCDPVRCLPHACSGVRFKRGHAHRDVRRPGLFIPRHGALRDYAHLERVDTLSRRSAASNRGCDQPDRDPRKTLVARSLSFSPSLSLPPQHVLQSSDACRSRNKGETSWASALQRIERSREWCN